MKEGLIRQNCIESITYITGLDLDDLDKNTPIDCLDLLDFIEIVMEAEKRNNCTIDEELYDYSDFDTFEELIDWLYKECI